MKPTAATKVNDLLASHPHLLEFLVSYHPRYELLRNRVMRATMGRVATLELVASMADLPLDRLLADLQAEIDRHAAEPVPPAAATPALDDAARKEQLKAMIRRLHAGEPLDVVRADFEASFGELDPAEIPRLEQQLIQEGTPVEEIHKLCDVHVDLFKRVLSELPPPAEPAGHPVHTHMIENQEIARLATRLAEEARTLDGLDEAAVRRTLTTVGGLVAALGGVVTHYVRKENQLFPLLERHGITGPSMVMWGVHDQVRDLLKVVAAAVAREDATTTLRQVPELARHILEMIYKEEHILFPWALQTLDEAEWLEVRRGEDELGYAYATPGSDWPAGGLPASSPAAGTTAAGTPAAGLFALRTGQLTAKQIDLLLRALPVEVSLVDEHDEVRYYSDHAHRIFPRSPAVIGRQVQHCHPPASLGTVNKILESFRDGSRDEAEFWIEVGGKFVRILYVALRDEQGAYQGTLEVTQDLTRLRTLTGQKRLLDWE
ncbi:MAG: DUF438 domain-containing protein [Myxococcota bacterium]|jgi:DUF438 domain-containing protein|nr:DUF438 domain-containing protein [Myxococcota bacterium]